MESQTNFWRGSKNFMPPRHGLAPGLILPSLRVGMDLDGVHFNFADSVRHFLLTHYADKPFGDASYPDPERWDFFLDWGMTLPEFLRICNEGVDAGIIFAWGGTFHAWSRWVFDTIRDAGHTIHVVTDRSFGQDNGSQVITKAFLEAEHLHYDSLAFTADKTSVPTDIFIEDKVENYVALDSAGVEVWLIDRPWNRHLLGARRIFDLREFPGKVHDLALRRAAADGLVGV